MFCPRDTTGVLSEDRVYSLPRPAVTAPCNRHEACSPQSSLGRPAMVLRDSRRAERPRRRQYKRRGNSR